MPRPKSELTKFILGLPATLSTAEVVEKVKAAGMETTESNVHRVRRGLQKRPAKAPAAKAPAAKAPAAKAPEAPKADADKGEGAQSKAGFVRSLPRTMPVKDVVAKAKAAGLEISEKYVYGIRADAKPAPAKSSAKPAKKAAPAPKKAQAPAAKKPAAPAAEVASGSPREAQLRRLVLELGIARSRKVLDEMEQRLEALIRG
jgi:chemotaxis protein histidine kinase CheA